jgi:hypothetical protein
MAESELDIEAHQALIGIVPLKPLPSKRIEAWVEKLIRFNDEKKLFSPDAFESLCYERMHMSVVPAGWAPLWLKRWLSPEMKKLARRLVFMMKN